MQINDPYNQSVEIDEDNNKAVRRNGSQKSKKPKNLIMLLLVLGIFASLAIGAMKLFTHKNPAAKTATNIEKKSEQKVEVADLPNTTTTKEYENGPMGLTLTYPSDWTATETSDNGTRIESPVFNYKNLDGDPVSGSFRIYIRKGARAADRKYIGRGVAIQESIKTIYKKPAAGQRADTLVTNFGLDTADNFAYFFVAGNFQLKVGDTLGPDYGKEPETYIVSGGYSSKDLKDDMATNTVPVDYIIKSNAYKLAIEIIKSLQLH